MVEGNDDGAAVDALTSEVNQLYEPVNGLDDHGYGVVDYPSPSLGPIYIGSEAVGEEQMSHVGAEDAFDGMVEIQETFGVEGAVATEVVVDNVAIADQSSVSLPLPPEKKSSKAQLNGLACMYCRVGVKAKAGKSKGRWLRCGHQGCSFSFHAKCGGFESAPGIEVMCMCPSHS